jgi:protein SCO1/2
MPTCRCSPRRAEARRRRDRKGLVVVAFGAACLLLLASCYLWLLGTPPRATAAIGGPFQLIASDGRIINERSFPSHYELLYFGYTHCRDACPTTLDALAGALDALGRRADLIQPLFVTLDPGRDTAQVLRAYLASFTPRLLGLTGTQEQISTIERAYRVSSNVHPAPSGSYDLDHSSVLYLMSPDGHFVAPIRADAPAAEMAVTLAGYVP